MRRAKYIGILALVAASGCINLELQSEMHELDSDSVDTAGSGDSDSDSDSDGDADGDGDGDADTGPPDTDPEDFTPPSVYEAWCGLGERNVSNVCVAEGAGTASLRFYTDEPASISIEGPEQIHSGLLSAEWSDEHHFLIVGLEPLVETSVNILLADVNANSSIVSVVMLARDGAKVAITEVLADPKGVEPDQEFVEIANWGAETVDLGGWMIDDNADWDGDTIPSGTVLEAGKTAMLVAPDFLPGEGGDPAPASSAIIVHLDSSIASSGLKNSEAETVELYDSFGVLVSSYNGQLGGPVEGKSAARTMAELPDGDELAFGDGPIDPPNPGVVNMLGSGTE